MSAPGFTSRPGARGFRRRVAVRGGRDAVVDAVVGRRSWWVEGTRAASRALGLFVSFGHGSVQAGQLVNAQRWGSLVRHDI